MIAREQQLTELTYFRGRVAMYALLKALGVRRGDEIALQAFTCLAVPEGIMALGAKPLYVDIEPDGFNLSAQDLERKLTPKTRAIVVQHSFGIPADMQPLLTVAEAHGLPMIEDCCHTLVSGYGGNTVGTLGVGAFYSFEWGKPIVVGIGGSAVINEPSLRAKVVEAYSHYRQPVARNQFRLSVQYLAHALLYRPILYWPVRALYHRLRAMGAAESNYNPINENTVAKDFSLRMAEPLQRRLVRKIARLDDVTTHARQVAEQYQKEINRSDVRHPSPPPGSQVVYARYPLRVQEKARLLTAAKKANVELADWYATPVHPLESKDWRLVHYEPGSCPNVEQRCGEVVTLPTHPKVTDGDVARTIAFLNKA